MKRMTMVLGVAVVLGVMVLGSSAAMAAPTLGGTVAVNHSSSFSILDVLAKLLGFGSVTAGGADSSRGQKTTTPTTATGASTGTGSITPEGAIWGRCLYLGTC